MFEIRASSTDRRRRAASGWPARALRTASILLLAASSIACGRSDAPDAGRSAVPAGDRPDVILVSIDSLRADRVGAQRQGRSITPFLDRLAAEGATFTQATSSSSWTLPAHATLFTGLPAAVHGADRGHRVLPENARMLPEAMQAAGYRTLGVWSGPLLAPSFGFAQGFDRYLDRVGCRPASEGDVQLPGQDAYAASHQGVTGPQTLACVSESLKATRDLARSAEGRQPLFLFVHLWDPHYDYEPPAPFDSFDPDYRGEVDGSGLGELATSGRGALTDRDVEHLRALYDGEVASTDRQVAELWRLLEQHGVADDALWIVTSDHGDEFFEHGHFGHKRTVYDEVVRVPLLIRHPPLVAAGQTIAAAVGLDDLAPTILELAGAEPLPDIAGRSLVPLLNGGELAPRPTLSEQVFEGNDRTLRAWRTPSWKVIVDDSGVLGLYDLAADPGETTDVWGVDTERTAAAQQALRDGRATLESLARAQALDGVERELSAETRAQLESLGYLASSESPVAAKSDLLWIEPQPLRLCGSDELGIVTVGWNVPRRFGDVEIRIDAADGRLFAAGGPSGSATTDRWATAGLRFVLVAGGEARASARVRTTRAGC